MPPCVSGMTEQEVREVLAEKGHSVWSESRFSISTPSADVLIAEVRVADYTDRGIAGELVLEFADDRLAKTIFFPLQLDQYLETIADELSHDLRIIRSLRLGPSTRVWLAGDNTRGEFMGWRDEELVRTYDAYLER
jgi:hypothetical protein